MVQPAREGGRLGVILGSGAAALADRARSDRAVEVVARHLGAGGSFVPAHLVDHAAHISTLAEHGCDRVVSVNSVGSLRADWPVGSVVIPDDFLALQVTPSSFTDERGHTVPGFDLPWRMHVVEAWNEAAPSPAIDGGVYAQTTGPRFETRAEIRMLASFADIVGMTVAAECILAREAGLAYAAVCVVDNLANGVGDDGRELDIDEFTTGKDANRPHIEAILAAFIGALA